MWHLWTTVGFSEGYQKLQYDKILYFEWLAIAKYVLVCASGGSYVTDRSLVSYLISTRRSAFSSTLPVYLIRVNKKCTVPRVSSKTSTDDQ